jgi:hypothetical protein
MPETEKAASVACVIVLPDEKKLAASVIDAISPVKVPSSSVETTILYEGDADVPTFTAEAIARVDELLKSVMKSATVVVLSTATFTVSGVPPVPIVKDTVEPAEPEFITVSVEANVLLNEAVLLEAIVFTVRAIEVFRASLSAVAVATVSSEEIAFLDNAPPFTVLKSFAMS